MIYDYPHVDMMYIQTIKNLKHTNNDKRKSRHIYKDIVTAFDIETTGLDDIQQAVLYNWQWAFGDDFVVMGRTWDELYEFMSRLCTSMKENEFYVVYVHNLSYEFHFLRAILDWESVFAVDKRKVLRAEAMGHFEFRCGYLHSNMSLKEYTEKMGAKHKKLDGEEFDYSIKRFPWTPLTDKERQYCYNDVVGLVECLEIEMNADGDNLYTIPLTSTGYVRRECKKAMEKVSQYIVKKSLPDIEIFRALREAFRGGNTHANRYRVGEVIESFDGHEVCVTSYDRSSSYPDVQCNCEFPVGSWSHVDSENTNEFYLRDLMGARHKAVLMRVAFVGLELRDKYWGCPYIARAKCEEPTLTNGVYDNGRVLSADYAEMTITDIDFKIIESEYKWKNLEVGEMWYSRYGKLPKELTDVIKKLYRDKTSLKDVAGQEVFYTKQKNKLNSVYGMSAQNPAKPDIIYSILYDDLFKFDVGATAAEEEEKERARLEEANKKAWFLYAWGVWTTAWARLRLEEGIRIAGRYFVYCDTDSVKYINHPSISWEEYNKERIRDSKASGSYATDKNGVVHYMGVYEEDKGVPYQKFVTFGAKKYAYVDKKGKLSITIAGVDKRKGAKELEKAGGIDALNLDFIFTYGGGTASIYNDRPSITEYVAEGHKIKITPNIYISNSTYTLGFSHDYAKLLAMLEKDDAIILYE